MRRWNRQFAVAVVLMVGLSGVARAEWQQSANYGINESDVGAGGDFSGASGGYSFVPFTDDSGTSLGQSAVGNSASSGYQSNGGFNTTAQPGLTLLVNTASVDLDVLSTLVAKTATASFSVKNYTAYGYAVTIVGTPPTNSGHALTAMGTQSQNSSGCSPSCDPATPGTAEQFGINLRDNSAPNVGSDPNQYPDSTFSFGVAGDGVTGTYGSTRPYTIVDKFRFFSGDTIASAPKSSGQTDYTISFLANITPVTPGGAYTGALSIVATGTY